MTPGYEIDDNHNTPENYCKKCTDGFEVDDIVKIVNHERLPDDICQFCSFSGVSKIGIASVEISVDEDESDGRIFPLNSDVRFSSQVTQLNDEGVFCRDVEYEWNFGDEGSSERQFDTHRFTEPGNYTVSLTANCKECPDPIVTDSIRITIKEVKVKYTEYPSQGYGWDDYTDQNVPWKSIAHSSSDKVLAEITLGITLSDMFFSSDNTDVATITPSVPNDFFETLSVFSSDSSIGVTTIGAVIDNVNSDRFNVITYQPKTLSVYVVLVNEKARGNSEFGDDDHGYTSSPIDISLLENTFNNAYKQAAININLRVTEVCTAEFDRNNDGKLEVEWGSGNPSQEMQLIISECEPPNSSSNDYVIYIVDNPLHTIPGFDLHGIMQHGQKHGFVFPNSSPGHVFAHELGHGAFRLDHTSEDTFNLMFNDSSIEGILLRKSQWDQVQSLDNLLGQ